MQFPERNPNTTQWGGSFDHRVVDAVWAKAQPSQSFVRTAKTDVCGAAILRGEYGTESLFGWEIDHIVPVASGGTDDLPNLQPLHWKNNRSKGDGLEPSGWCVVTG